MSVDRYALCSCGSGKKFKFCCGDSQVNSLSASVHGAAGFPIEQALFNPDWQTSGIAEVLVVRRKPDGSYFAGSYLIDTLCLGVKNTFVTNRLDAAGLNRLRNGFASRIEEVSYEDARSLVLGAVAYARALGIEPHADWKASAALVESDRPFKNRFTFGHGGKPLYVEGPHDDTRGILRKLDRLIREGKVDYLVGEKGATAFVNPQEADFEERCDRIGEWIETRRTREADSAIEALLQEYPDRWQPFFFKGTLLCLQKKFEYAAEWLQRSIEIHPTAEAYYNLSGIRRHLLNISEYVSDLEKAIELDEPGGETGKRAKTELNAFYADAAAGTGLSPAQYRENARDFQQAVGHLEAGRFEDAAAGFRRVLKANPNNVQSHGNLGLACAALGDKDAALRHLNRALELDPTYTLAATNRDLILKQGDRPVIVSTTDFYADRERVRQRVGL